MTDITFEPFPKLARLNRNIVVTEKLDGTNAAVLVVERPWGPCAPDANRIAITLPESPELDANGLPAVEYHVYAQSRNRFITPKDDNYGFAGWVKANAEALVLTLGTGRHFGEWWGSGIQRGYGLTGGDKRFSLFNTGRWNLDIDEVCDQFLTAPGLRVVPVLYEGPFDQFEIEAALEGLRETGSAAEPDFDRPEGIVIYHEAARQSFKITLEGDAAPKAQPRREHDLLPEAVTA